MGPPSFETCPCHSLLDNIIIIFQLHLNSMLAVSVLEHSLAALWHAGMHGGVRCYAWNLIHEFEGKLPENR